MARSYALDLVYRAYWSDLLKACCATKILYLNDKDKLTHLDTILLAIEHNYRVLQRLSKTLGSTTCGQYIVQDCNLKLVARESASSDIAEAVVELIKAILLLDEHLVQVALGKWELAALANRDNILHMVALREKRGCKQETTSLGSNDIGCRTCLANTSYELLIDSLILQKWDNIDKHDTLFREIFVVFKYLFHSGLIYKTYKVNNFLQYYERANNKFYKFVTSKIVFNLDIMKKRVLVTGATSGIGRATALRLAEPNTEIIITGRRKERLEALKLEVEAKGAECVVLNFDVRSEAECIEHLKPLGRVDILINNAGLAAGLEHIDKGDSADWDAMIDTNVKGLLYVTKIISGAMVEAGKGGHIINIGSIAGTEPYENGAVYCASKHAVHAISQAMRADLLSAGIKVGEVRPGMVETEFSEVRFHGDKQRAAGVYNGVEALQGEDIAEAIHWMLNLPAHMNVNDIVLMPTCQAGAYYTYRK